MKRIKKFNRFLLLEGQITNEPTREIAVMFTDLMKSSELWAKYPDEMAEAIDLHYLQVDKIVNDNSGFIMKTIGDAFMCSFDDVNDAIKAAIEIQKDKSVPVGERNLIMRIGICYGPAIIKKITIQDADLIDYFGNTINSASRLETEVSEVGGFAIASTSKKITSDDIKDVIKDFNFTEIQYTSTPIKERIRSSRLLTDTQIFHKDIKDLHGIKPIVAYSIKSLNS